jgi:hypothetical protein
MKYLKLEWTLWVHYPLGNLVLPTVHIHYLKNLAQIPRNLPWWTSKNCCTFSINFLSLCSMTISICFVVVCLSVCLSCGSTGVWSQGFNISATSPAPDYIHLQLNAKHFEKKRISVLFLILLSHKIKWDSIQWVLNKHDQIPQHLFWCLSISIC